MKNLANHDAVQEAEDRYYPILSKLYEDKKEMALSRYTVFIIGGVAQNGKDQWIEYMNDKGSFAAVESSIDPVKDITKLMETYEESKLGYSALRNAIDAKTDAYRELLFQLKKTWNIIDNGPNRIVMSRIWNHRMLSEVSLHRSKDHTKCCFVHVREPDEIQKWISKLEDSRFICTTICVRGHSSQDDFQNHCDRQTLDYDYDIYVDNDDGLDQLRDDAYGFRSAYLKAYHYTRKKDDM